MLSVVDHGPSSLDIPQTLVVSRAQRISARSVPLNQVEMDKHTGSGQQLESRANHYGLCASTDTNVCQKPHGLGNEGDIESGRNEMMTAG